VRELMRIDGQLGDEKRVASGAVSDKRLAVALLQLLVHFTGTLGKGSKWENDMARRVRVELTGGPGKRGKGWGA
jgi:hypothetical protein